MNQRPETSDQSVRQFVSAVRKRLNRFRGLDAMILAAAICGAAMTIVAVAYVWPGYAVPLIWYAIAASVMILVAGAIWLFTRVSGKQAAHFADRKYGLKDATRAHGNFSAAGRFGEFYDLQARQTGEAVAAQQIEQISWRPQYRLAFIAMITIGIAVALGFRGPSDAVLERQQRELETAQLTDSINEQIKELIEQLDEAIDDPSERELVNPDKLRQWVDELKQTTDHKEALRQYAMLQRKLNIASTALQSRKEEQLLAAAAEKLRQDPKSKELAKNLKQKKFERAAKQLRDLKPDGEDAKQQKLSDKRKQLARLKAVANRMADAARSMNSKSKSNGKNNSKSDRRRSGKNSNAAQSRGGSGKSNSDQSGEDGDQEGELAEMIEDLEDAVEYLDDALELAELQDLEDGEQLDLDDCEECEGRLAGELDELADRLIKLARKRKAMARLKKLIGQCAGCQSGLSQMRIASTGKGGKKPGTGTSDSTRDQRDKLTNNGQYSKLKGVKGRGPSLVTTEEASDGTGVSHLKSKAAKREFQHQFESFVQREDIPENLKQGVRNYFTHIHELGQQEPSDDSAEQGEQNR